MDKVSHIKPELFRLATLDLIVISACAWLFCKQVSPAMFAPILLAKLTILSYGIYLLAQKLGKSGRTP